MDVTNCKFAQIYAFFCIIMLVAIGLAGCGGSQPSTSKPAVLSQQVGGKDATATVATTDTDKKPASAHPAADQDLVKSTVTRATAKVID